jgi:hypothetical protein
MGHLYSDSGDTQSPSPIGDTINYMYKVVFKSYWAIIWTSTLNNNMKALDVSKNDKNYFSVPHISWAPFSQVAFTTSPLLQSFELQS